MILPITVSRLSNYLKQNVHGKLKAAQRICCTRAVAVPPTHPTTIAAAGLHPLGLDEQRDGFVYVPKTYRKVV